MKAKLNLLVCATIVATHWEVTANAQVGFQGSSVSGAVYTMTNDASENSVLVYSRNSNGVLTFQGPVSTHGRGSGGILDPLQSQGSLVPSQDGSFLFAANPAGFARRPVGGNSRSLTTCFHEMPIS
jgi:6-phosphogluconolactonase